MADAAAHAHGHDGHAHQFETAAQQKEAVSIGMWAFLVNEVMFFGGIFLCYTVYRALYGGHVLEPASLAEMIAALASDATKGATVPYGLGIQAVTLDGRPTLGHSGRLLGFRSVARWLPNERVTIATLTNQSRADPTTITRSLLRLALTPVVSCLGRRGRL